MGTLNYTVGAYARTKGSGAASTLSSHIRTSDAYTTSTTAGYVEDGSGDITVSAGEIFIATIDEAAWIRFPDADGDTVATVGDGHYMPADTERAWEIEFPGKVSIIDVA